MQFRVLVDDFLRYCALERRLSAHTVQAYTVDLADFRKWLGADTAPSGVTADTLRAYLEYLVATRKAASATVRRRFACLRAFFRRAAERGYCPDPFAAWRPALPRRKRLPRTLSRSEASSLLLSCGSGIGVPQESGFTFRIIVRLMVATGMRVGEICRLRIDDVSPEVAALRIQGKGSRERIAYVADPALRAELAQLRQYRALATTEVRCLFINRCGAPLRPQSIRSKLRRLATRAGVSRRVTPHMLRHTAATLLIETGVDIRFVQRLLGHASIATTEIYTHVSDEALRVTLERADVLGSFAAHSRA